MRWAGSEEWAGFCLSVSLIALFLICLKKRAGNLQNGEKGHFLMEGKVLNGKEDFAKLGKC